MDASLTTRFLQLAGPEEDPAWRENLKWFRLFILLHALSRSFLAIQHGTVVNAIERHVCVALAVVCAIGLLGAIVPGLTLWITRLAAVIVLVELFVSLPFTANHLFLELVLLTLLGVLDERDDREGELLLQVLRWMVAIFFFYTGLQKMWYGYYYQAEMLTYLAGTEERFQLFFKHLIPAAEMQRLLDFNFQEVSPGRFRPRTDSGPYRVDSLGLIVVSNAVYIFEMAAGVMLVFRRTRGLASVASIAFVILVECAVRELTFGALMICLLLLYLPGKWVKWTWPGFAVFYALLAVDMIADGKPLFWYSPA